METPDFFELELPAGPGGPGPDAARLSAGRPGGLWAAGERITWVAGLVLALSSFMGWYAGSGVGVKLAVIGWHTGILGKLVFFIGLAVVAIVVLREAGFELPPAIPESLVMLGLGALAAIFVLIRIISIPDAVLPADGRGIGIWISLRRRPGRDLRRSRARRRRALGGKLCLDRGEPRVQRRDRLPRLRQRLEDRLSVVRLLGPVGRLGP